MQFGWLRSQKPPIGTPLDRTHPLLNGLLWYAPFSEGGGTRVIDLIGGVNLTTSGGPVWVPGSSPMTGAELSLTSTSMGANNAILPATLKLQPPVTLVCGFRRIGIPTSSSLIFGTYPNNTGAAPYNAYSIYYSNTVNLAIGSSNSSNYPSSGNTFTPTTGIDYVLVAVFNPTTYTFYVYPLPSGVPSVYSGSWGVTIGPVYSSTALIGCGANAGAARNLNGNVWFAGMYSRALSAIEAAAWGRNPWQIFAPSQGVAALASAVAGTFSIAQTTIPANHAGNISITLTGVGTTWSSNTFTPSGVANVVKVSQVIHSMTSATLVVTTGAGTGTLTVSDGTKTATTTVATSSFTLSRSSGSFSVPTSITATGVASVWTQETAATLFSTPGTHGDSISSVVVNSDISATFLLVPGAATGSLVITEGPVATTSAYTINGVAGSLRVTGPWQLTGPSNSLFYGQTTFSVSWFVKYNFAPTATCYIFQNWFENLISAIGTPLRAGYNFPTGPTYTGPFSPGSVYHVSLTWNSTSSFERYNIYLDGAVVASGSTTLNQTLTSQPLGLLLFYLTNGTMDVQMANLAIWDNYELTSADVLNLRNGTYVPGSLIGSSSAMLQSPASWWLLANAASGTPASADTSFTDYGSTGANTFAIQSGSTLLDAQYAAPLVYSPPTLVTPWVAKSGRLLFFMTQSNSTSSAAVTGLSVKTATPSILTTAAPQSSWIGLQVTIVGDSSSGTYKITGGFGESWTISPPYGGASNAVNANGTLITAYPVSNVIRVAAEPTISVQFGGTGAHHAVSTWGPVWTQESLVVPWAAWQLLCGPVPSVIVQVPGSGYSNSPSTTISGGGGGSGLTLGTPLVSGGVTSYAVTAGGSKYGPAVVVITDGTGTGATATLAVVSGVVTGATLVSSGSNYSGSPTATIYGGGSGTGATVTLTTSGGLITGISIAAGGSNYSEASNTIAIVAPTPIAITATVTNNSTAVTGITSTVGLYPGMTVLGTGSNPNFIASVVSGTAITLQYPATASGSAMTVVGKQAMATPTIVNGVMTAVNVFVPGTGYAGTAPSTSAGTITIAGPGAGAVITSAISSAIAYVPVTAPGSGYTSPPSITITDGTGTGAVVVSSMGGVGPSDVVTYAATENWLSTQAGGAPAAPSAYTTTAVANYSGQLEPGIGAFYGFNTSSSERSMELGYNIAYEHAATGFPFCSFLNWWKRQAGASTRVVTSAIDRRPLTITGTSANPTSFVLTSPYGGGNDFLPLATGVWTFVVDDVNGSLPLNVSLTETSYEPALLISSPTITPGTATNGVNSIAFTITNGGSGYTDYPNVTIEDPTGTGATAYALIGNGNVTHVYLVATGSNYTKPTVVISGGNGTGATATCTAGPVLVGQTWQWTVGRATASDATQLMINVWKTGATGTPTPYQYSLTNEYLFSPAASAAASPGVPVRAAASQIDPGLTKWLTTSTPKYPAVLRFMDSTGGADFTAVEADDFKNKDSWSWYNRPYLTGSELTNNSTGNRQFTVNTVRTYCLSITGVGYCTMTSVGSGYVTPPTVTITDPNGTGATGTAILGATTGTTGQVVAIYMPTNGSGYTSPTVTLTGGGGTGATATATVGMPSGWGTVNWQSPNVYTNQWGTATPGWTAYSASNSHGGPFYLVPSSIGYLNENRNLNTGWYVGECVTDLPHNLKNGEIVALSSSSTGNPGTNTGTYSISNGVGAYITGLTNAGGLVFVTGPTTFVWCVYTGSITPGSGVNLPGGMNNVAGTFPVSWTFYITKPDGYYGGTIPFEITAQIAGSFPGCDLWVNIPWGMTDAGSQALARYVRDNFPVGRNVYVEYTNENWNSATYSTDFTYAMGQLNAWTSPGADYTEVYATRTFQHHNIFVSIFNKPDINGVANRGGEIKRLFGGWYASPGTTTEIVSWANAPGNQFQVDAVAVAPYINSSFDSTSPTTAAVVTTPSGSTSLTPGTYLVYYTWVDSVTGIETNVGASVATLMFSSSSVLPTVTLPAFPTWGSITANIYLTPIGGAPGTETLYATGITSTVATLSSGSWSSTSPPAINLAPNVTLGTALLATHWPTSIAYKMANPWTRAMVLELYRYWLVYGSGNNSIWASHQAALNNYDVGNLPVPALVSYEGGTQILVSTSVQTGPDPTGVYLCSQLSEDLFYDPAMYDVETAFYWFCQQGGMSLYTPYHLAGYLGGNGGAIGQNLNLWPAAIWSGQAFGKGDGTLASNGVDITNLFWSETQAPHHDVNAAPRLNAWNDWSDSANPFVIPGDTFVTPANGSINVSPRVVIVVEFNEPMLGSTITSATFSLKFGGTSVPGTVAYNPMTWIATFTPAGILRPLLAHTAQLTTGVNNAHGVALSNPVTWSFTTGASTASPSLPWFPSLNKPTSRGY